ncbi:MAG: hydantoinase/oxoprolinase family protein [Solirubrobacteraceae bacterium]
MRIVNNTMANALRVGSIEKGYDVRDFALMAFGGSGPLHAAALVDELGIGRILVPRGYASVLCALGDVLADIRESRRRGYYARSETVDLVALSEAVAAMVAEADAIVSDHARTLGRVVECGLEMRYKGQTHEVTVPIGTGLEPTPARWEQVLADFDRLHEQRFSFSRPGAEVEVIGLEVDRFALRRKPSLDGLGAACAGAPAMGERLVHFLRGRLPADAGLRRGGPRAWLLGRRPARRRGGQHLGRRDARSAHHARRGQRLRDRGSAMSTMTQDPAPPPRS